MPQNCNGVWLQSLQSVAQWLGRGPGSWISKSNHGPSQPSHVWHVTCTYMYDYYCVYIHTIIHIIIMKHYIYIYIYFVTQYCPDRVIRHPQRQAGSVFEAGGSKNLRQWSAEVPRKRSALSACPYGDPWGTPLQLEISYSWAPVKPRRGQTLRSPRPKVTSVLTRLRLVVLSPNGSRCYDCWYNYRSLSLSLLAVVVVVVVVVVVCFVVSPNASRQLISRIHGHRWNGLLDRIGSRWRK